MKKCKSCNSSSDRLLFTCVECGSLFCEKCANQTKKICPKCFSSLDFYD